MKPRKEVHLKGNCSSYGGHLQLTTCKRQLQKATAVLTVVQAEVSNNCQAWLFKELLFKDLFIINQLDDNT